MEEFPRFAWESELSRRPHGFRRWRKQACACRYLSVTTTAAHRKDNIMSTFSSALKKASIKENSLKFVFISAAFFSVVTIVSIFVFLISGSASAIGRIGIFNFLFGPAWNSNVNDTFVGEIVGSYGIMPLIVSTFASAVGALFFGGVIGFFAGTYLARFCPKKANPYISQLINLLAAIPSIVYGFFGMMIILPILSFVSPSGEGTGVLALSIVLGLMIVPTVTALTKTSIENVDKSLYTSAVAMGLPHERAVFAAEVPSAKNGVMAALLLGIGRALGETLTAVMLAGNAIAYPTGLFRSIRTIPGNVAIEIEGAGDLQLGALIGSALVLFILVLSVFALYNITKNSTKKKQGLFSKVWDNTIARYTGASKLFSIISILIAIFVLASIILLILINGIPHLRPQFLTGAYTGGFDTIAPAIVTTLMYIALTATISFPIGICTAIFLTEYTKKQSKSRITQTIEIAIDTLSGIPSVIIGLFGVVVFVNFMGFGISILAGCLTISLMIIPLTARATQEALRSVPASYREGAYALGIGKARTTFKLLLPSAIPGILTMVILSVGRMLSDSAAVMFTMGGFLGPMPIGFFSEGSTLATAIFVLGYQHGHIGEAYATASILIIIVLSLNLLSTFVLNRFKKANK